MQSLLYALTFPNFIVTEWGSEAIWREDGGKVLERSASWVEQTQYVNGLWWWYGPHDERTKKSVDGINRLHGHWAGKYPGRFSYNEDYVYVCSFSAILMHRLLIQMGLPGVSPKEQIAAYKFWSEMSKLFVAEGGVPLHGYPEDFEHCIRYCDGYENAPRPKPERANLVGMAIHEQFVFRFFTKEMHWLGHQLIRSITLPTTLKALQIDPPLPMAKEVLPKMLGLVFWHHTFMQDDPPRSFVEDRENLDADQRKPFGNSSANSTRASRRILLQPTRTMPASQVAPSTPRCPVMKATSNPRYPARSQTSKKRPPEKLGFLAIADRCPCLGLSDL